MQQAFNDALTHIEKAETILLTTHERTDGDDLGSVLAIAEALVSQKKRIALVISGGTPSQLRFLPRSSEVKETLPTGFTPDLVIFSGCSKVSRANLPFLSELNVPFLNFDHHPDNSNFGKVNIVDHTKSSVAELMYDFFHEAKWEINKNSAQCLLTGMFTDTGSFMHSNTKQTTLRAAAELIRKGASIGKVAKFTYRGKNPFTLRAWGHALMNTYYDKKKKIIYSVLTEKDMHELKNVPLSAFEGFVETLNKVPEAKFALFLKQDGGVIKGSLRSDPHKGVNVQQIAKIFGGGGHMWASGFSIVGKLEKDLAGKWIVKQDAR